jgi:hypothetical protein
MDHLAQNDAADVERQHVDAPASYLDLLYNADPDCNHEIYGASGGGIKCKHCTGWFCY